MTATPAMEAAIAQRLISTLADPTYRGLRHPTDLEDRVLWALARYGNHPEFWRMAMIQLMARAAKTDAQGDQDVGFWNEIGAYLMDEASPAQLDEGVLWRYANFSPVRWRAAKVSRMHRRLVASSKQEQSLAVAA